jgi:hypothetical protein
MSKQSSRKAKRPTNKLHKITLWLPSQQALNEVLASADVELSCATPRRENDGTYRVEIYTSPTESKKITELGYRNEVDKAYGEVLAKRQEEVSKTDRYKGGKIKPNGLGERR